MIRPCDECEGHGVLGVYEHVDPDSGEHLGNESIPCPRCADMPRLPAGYATRWAETIKPKREATNILEPLPDWYQRGEPFYPDPTTVMRWCRTHESMTPDANRCVAAMLMFMFETYRPADDISWREAVGDCDIVWVEKPGLPLSEVDQ